MGVIGKSEWNTRTHILAHTNNEMYTLQTVSLNNNFGTRKKFSYEKTTNENSENFIEKNDFIHKNSERMDTQQTHATLNNNNNNNKIKYLNNTGIIIEPINKINVNYNIQAISYPNTTNNYCNNNNNQNTLILLQNKQLLYYNIMSGLCPVTTKLDFLNINNNELLCDTNTDIHTSRQSTNIYYILNKSIIYQNDIRTYAHEQTQSNKIIQNTLNNDFSCFQTFLCNNNNNYIITSTYESSQTIGQTHSQTQGARLLIYDLRYCKSYVYERHTPKSFDKLDYYNYNEFINENNSCEESYNDTKGKS